MASWHIPFNKPCLIGNEERYMSQALANGHISGDGPFTRSCSALLQNELGIPKALLTTSCTHALEMSALLLNIQPGDEVIVPDFTFVSTVNAFVLRGARPVFIDIRPDTLNLDERLLEKLITPRTRAILPVHYAGVGCEMAEIIPLAERFGIPVVEDNAHGLFAKYYGKFLGTFGSLATQSFHETKNFTCGEGGALLINDAALIERAEILREKGTNRNRFFLGLVDKYTWVDIGSSYLPSDMLAGFLLAQLEERQRIQAKRKSIWLTYQKLLESWAAERNIRLPIIPEYCEQSYHMYYILLPSLAIRQELIEFLKQSGILAVFHYLPLHLSNMGQQFGGKQGDCPICEDISDRLLRLPFYYDLTESNQEEIVNCIQEFFNRSKTH
jgi:dTDP-4-amino-4,6-dideoxygalactose transaminase